MAKQSFTSAGVTAQEIDRSGPVSKQPTGTPAGVIGTALKGPAFVPVTLGVDTDFYARFGPTDAKKFGPLAVSEWLAHAGAVTYLRVLGAGTGEKRTTTGNTAGIVTSAGFVVGERQPDSVGALVDNPYANSNGVPGRTYFLGCYMSESNGSTLFSDAGIQGSGSPIASVASSVEAAVPIVRGVVLAASGVVLRLSSSHIASDAPGSTDIATATGGKGALTGTVKLLDGTVAKQEFVMLLNGHKGTDASYPNVLTASFDATAPNYFANVFNSDPYKLQESGHYLYARYDVHPSFALPTGTAVVAAASGAGGSLAHLAGAESIAFMTTGSQAYNVGSTTVPNYENFQDRFASPKSPWVISQKFGGAHQDLFRVDSLDDGDYAAEKIKISIENLAASTDTKNRYGTFDLLVRAIDDTDDNPVVYESYRGLSLDPSSNRYIAKVIGDQHVYFDFDKSTASQKLALEGSFPNASNWIRVTMNSQVDNAESDATAMPFGFRGASHLVTSGSAPLTAQNDSTVDGEITLANTLFHSVQPPVPFRSSITEGVGTKAQVNSSLYWGVKFQLGTSLDDLNKGKLYDKTIDSYARYYPDFMTSVQNVVVGDNAGAADTTENGVLDADRFENDLFTLENVLVTTGSDDRADTGTVSDWTYQRAGGIAANDVAKTRGMSLDDLKKSAVRNYAKYSFFLQGGFDGSNMFDKTAYEMVNEAIVEEMNYSARGLNKGPTVSAYNKALDIMQNVSDVDIQLLAIPGIRHNVVTDAAISMVEDRFDAMYIMDIDSYDELDSLVTSSADQHDHVANTVAAFTDRALDSSFAAAYYPDLIMTDPTLKTSVRVPPSVNVLGAFALNDAVGFPWFAPAGFTRGAMASVSEAAVKLSQDNLDQLYAADINPIVAFPNSNGPVVWGQKTLQQAQTALDRVNVRRLLIELRRQVRQVAETIIFEPNRASTLARFQAAVKPRIDAVQARKGLTRYKVVIDTTTTTQADIENNILRGKIYIQPTHVAEFVSLDFTTQNAI